MYTYVDQINNVYETSENGYEIVVFRWSIKFLNKKNQQQQQQSWK